MHRPARMDYRGLVLIASGVALSVFGFQQSSIWGWSNPATWACIVVGVALLVVFYFVELRTASPLIAGAASSASGPFLVENLVLGISMLVFIPVFFFASEYAQIALGKSAVAGQSRPAVLLPRIRHRGADRRADARPGRGQAPGRARLRAGRRRVLAVGRKGDRARLRLPAVVRHPRRSRHGLDARSGQHRRRQPGLAALLRRGDRHHPDGPQLRRQPGAGDPRHHPGLADALAGSPRR